MEQSLKALNGYRINYGLLMHWQLELVPACVLRKQTPFPVVPSFAPVRMDPTLTPASSPDGMRLPQ
eukprot:12885736-Prorocentrum_lima.AAC.1